MNGWTLDIGRSYLDSVTDWFRYSLNKVQAASASDLVHKVLETYITQILRVALGLVLTIMVARILGPQGRGLYAVALAIGALGVQVGNFGLGSSNIYYVAKDHDLLAV